MGCVLPATSFFVGPTRPLAAVLKPAMQTEGLHQDGCCTESNAPLQHFLETLSPFKLGRETVALGGSRHPGPAAALTPVLERGRRYIEEASDTHRAVMNERELGPTRARAQPTEAFAWHLHASWVTVNTRGWLRGPTPGRGGSCAEGSLEPVCRGTGEAVTPAWPS